MIQDAKLYWLKIGSAQVIFPPFLSLSQKPLQFPTESRVCHSLDFCPRTHTEMILVGNTILFYLPVVTIRGKV